MVKYPNALPLPHQVHASRAKRNQHLLHAAKIGISFRLGVILLEFAGIMLINSSALFLDVLSSTMDILSSLFLIVCMKLAYRPPDQNHPFGHGRYEPLGGLLLGILLIALGGVMFVQQLADIFNGKDASHIHALSWLFPALAMVALEFAYRLMIRTARQENSPALAVDAVHYRIDSLTSLLATGALFVGGVWPEWSAMVDHGGALMIALFMMGTGLYASRDNFHQLMDRVPDSHFFECVRQAAFKTPGVEGTEKIRIQQYGPDAHVDIDIEVKPTLSVDKAHQISQQVRLEIQKAWPSVRDVTVHIEPYYANDH